MPCKGVKEIEMCYQNLSFYKRIDDSWNIMVELNVLKFRSIKATNGSKTIWKLGLHIYIHGNVLLYFEEISVTFDNSLKF